MEPVGRSVVVRKGRLRPASRHDRFQRGQAAGRCDLQVDALRDEFEQQSVKASG